MSSIKKRVLLIEDDAICLKQEKNLLEKVGFQVDAVGTALEGLELLNAVELEYDPQEFTAIFIDLHLPDLQGESVANIIRKTEHQGKKVPIIAVTAYATEENRLTLIKKGLTAIIEKPLTEQAILQIQI